MRKQSTKTAFIGKEVWLPVVGFEGYYEVSNKGGVRSLPKIVMRRDGKPYRYKGKILKPMDHSSIGHLMVALYDGEPTKRKKGLFRKLVHHLVLEAFVGPRPLGMQCRHLNGVAWDNRVENLAWGTVFEDREDQRRHGTLRLGENATNAKLNPKKVRKIRYLRNTKKMKLKDIAVLMNVSESLISSIATGKIWTWLK